MQTHMHCVNEALVERISNSFNVRAVEVSQCKRTHIYAHNFLNIQMIFNPIEVLES